VRNVLLSLEPGLGSIGARTIQEGSIDEETRTWRAGAMVLSLGGALAVVVAAVGMFGVMSYLVTQRTSEIGVRVALGASPARIAALVARHSGGMVVAGVAIGLAVAIAAGGLVEPSLFRTSGRDPIVLGSVAAILLLVAGAASVAPTRAALRVDPIEALRSE
jgi:ABC-type antimicrobial peptide transport system permease subunit